MNKPSLLQGICLAFGLSALALLALKVPWARPFFPPFQGLIAFLSGAYILALLLSHRARVGRLTLGGLATGILLAAMSLGLSATTMVLLAVVLIWLVRSLLYYSSLLAAGLDGMLGAVSLGSALGAAMLSGSLVPAIWCFFLLQTLWVCIPTSLARLGSQATGLAEAESPSAPDAFAQAYRAAEQAIRVMGRRTAG